MKLRRAVMRAYASAAWERAGRPTRKETARRGRLREPMRAIFGPTRKRGEKLIESHGWPAEKPGKMPAVLARLLRAAEERRAA